MIAGGFALAVVLLMLWLAGSFSPKMSAGTPATASRYVLGPGEFVVAVRTLDEPVTEPAVGTIHALHETTIASHILARVIEINLRAGQNVKQGEMLIRLDDTDLKARLQQEQAAADATRAMRDNASADERRYLEALHNNGVSQLQYDLAAATLRSQEASLVQANQAIAEAQAVLEYASIRSPMEGIVVDKRVDVGDTVTPGQPLLTIYDPHRMQLVANVRESLARRLTVGQPIDVRLDALDKTCSGQVSEIVPDSQSASRTFQVKVTGAFPPGLYTGMFGRIFVPLDHQSVLAIPMAAIRHVGQLELVDVLEEGSVHRRAVRTGRVLSPNCEILSGLVAGETVVVHAEASTEPTEAVQP
jgi:RND family efflux transporter MFP subunit